MDIRSISKRLFVEQADYISIPILSNAKDLFYFCVDLLLTGAEQMYGIPKALSSYTELTCQQAREMNARMKAVGISFDISEEVCGGAGHGMLALLNMDKHLDIAEYRLVMPKGDKRYALSFKLGYPS
jgi:hypothetical protein